MAACRLVALYRVSTDKQGESGLGLAAQEAAVRAYREATGCRLIASYTEVESGGHDDPTERPDFLRAVTHAKRANATLVIAKMDRLIRSLPVLTYLKTAGVRFVACDNPNANELTVDILVAVAANELRMIRERTKAALAAYKGRLGTVANLTDEGRAKGRVKAVVAVRRKADEFAKDMLPIVRELREAGQTLQQIADHLNGLEFRTARGKEWGHVAVKRVLERLD